MNLESIVSAFRVAVVLIIVVLIVISGEYIKSRMWGKAFGTPAGKKFNYKIIFTTLVATILLLVLAELILSF